MKKAYLLLTLFGAWCIVGALWYLLSVRDINASTTQNAGLAIAEIMVMILVSVLLGFGIAWYMREDYILAKQYDVKALLGEREKFLVERDKMVREIQTQRDRAKKAEHTLERARQTFHDDYIQVSRERDKVKEEKNSAQDTLSSLKDEYTLLQIQLGNEQQLVKELSGNLDELRQQIKQKEKDNSGIRYFINPFTIAATIESSDIDDLKKIKGIGPVIEKKLNMLGIVNFKQISELNEEAIDQISHTLKFFPDRIKRDHWVIQARELSKIKVK
jgi:predicted flap endonuclease-1-like 5' DNA nuclease